MTTPRRTTGALLALALLATGAATSTAGGAASTWGPRDPWFRPFDADSIWNTPIGSDAVYTPSGYPVLAANEADPSHLVRATAADPRREVHAPHAWRDRCNPASPATGATLHVPDDLIVPDAVQLPSGAWRTPNDQGVVLQPDGRTVASFAAMCRDEVGGPLYGWHDGPGRITDLYGEGRLGAHGASRMSSLGGAIRPGELVSARPIAHALDLILFTRYAATTPDGCFRWPAVGCDRYADPDHPDNRGRYQGSVPAMQIGSLLALPPDLTYADLGVVTAAGRKLFDAMQDFGGYWTEDSAWAANYLNIDASATADLAAFRARATRDEFGRIVAAAQVVANNSPDQIGGGGTPRAPRHENTFVGRDGEPPGPPAGPGAPAPTTTTPVPPSVASTSTVPPASAWERIPTGDSFADWFERPWKGGDWRRLGTGELVVDRHVVASPAFGEAFLVRDGESPDGRFEAEVTPGDGPTYVGLVGRVVDEENLVHVSVVRRGGSDYIGLWSRVRGTYRLAAFVTGVVEQRPMTIGLELRGRHATVLLDDADIIRTVLPAETVALLVGHDWGLSAYRPLESGTTRMDKVVYSR